MNSIIKYFPVLFVFLLTASAACSQFTDPDGGIEQEIKEIKLGHYSNYPEEGEIHKIISSEAEFSAEWEKTHKGTMPIPETPDINFDSRQVILLMLNTKSSGGYGIDNFKVYEDDSGIMVKYSEVHPGDDCITSRALTRPYKMVSFPKTDKTIRFEKGDTILMIAANSLRGGQRLAATL